MQNSQQNKPALELEYKLGELDAAAQAVLRLRANSILLLQGEMGTGKTTLIKAICKALGVRDEVSSPTFALVNEYRDAADQPVYHFDLYRLNEPEEALDFGIEEYFESGSLCLVEWPEKISKFLPPKFGLLTIEQTASGRNLKLYPEAKELTS